MSPFEIVVLKISNFVVKFSTKKHSPPKINLWVIQLHVFDPMNKIIKNKNKSCVVDFFDISCNTIKLLLTSLSLEAFHDGKR